MYKLNWLVNNKGAGQTSNEQAELCLIWSHAINDQGLSFLNLSTRSILCSLGPVVNILAIFSNANVLKKYTTSKVSVVRY